ncbi:MAG: hypothetical protein LBQ30_08560 [Treponema sp.]|jgi:hypothetical protein|nr:hypothetical protein [Treponema sp.]
MTYTSIDLFKQYTGVTTDDTEILHYYLDSAESIVEQYLQYTPVYAQHTSILNGNGRYDLHLKAKPVHTIQEVLIGGTPEPVQQFQASGEVLYSKTKPFPFGQRNVIINYTAGYDPNHTGAAGDDADQLIDGGDAFSEYEAELDGGGALIIPPLPKIITMTALRIAAILSSESNNNIGVTSTSFGESGGRTFISYTNFDKYLFPISAYRLLSI